MGKFLAAPTRPDSIGIKSSNENPPSGEKKNASSKWTESDIAAKKDASDGEKAASVSSYLRALAYGSSLDVLLFAAAALCAVGSGIVLPLMNIVFGNMVGGFNGYFTAGNEVSEDDFRSSTNSNALKIVYLFIGKFALTYVSMFCFRMAGLRVTAALRLVYIQSVFAQPISKLDEVSAGTVANTITASSNTIQSSITDRLSLLFQSLALLVAAYVVAFRYSWGLTLASSAPLLFLLLAYGISAPIALKLQQQADKADEKHASIAAGIFGSIRTVLSLGAETPLSEKYFHWVDVSQQRGLKLALVLGLQLAPAFFAMYAGYALSFWFGLELYEEGHIANVNTVIIVFFSVLIASNVMGGIVLPVMQISKAISASSGFFGIIDSERVCVDGIRDPDVSVHADIEFHDVSFAYPTRPDVQVLKGFSARFEKGKTTALVGPSGSGKSTIVALLERWYQLDGIQDCKEASADNHAAANDTETMVNVENLGRKKGNRGAIHIDGHNLNTLHLKWWRSQIGLVQQEPFLFNDSIFNNVAFGLIGSKWEKESEEVKRELVKGACKEAFADEFIERLPQGYSTIVGEGGIKLSGGQRQRLAIARSIVKRPAILILDEATSAIDVHGEKIVQEALDRVSQSRTTIMIAHRLSTIRKADHIIVLHDGTKIEEGSHEKLMSISDGMYRNLVNAQHLEAVSAPQTETDEVDTAPEEKLDPSKRTHADAEVDQDKTDARKTRTKYAALGRILYEQRARWPLYVLVVLAAMCCGAAYALQSWFFAQLVQVFQFTGQKLRDARNFWALMFFILALAMAVAYYVLGYISTSLSVSITSTYRKEYYKNILAQPISFYDAEDNASGSLMSRLSTDPKQIQEALGVSGAFPLVSIFNTIGCIAISFSFGWKLSLVTLFAALPVLFLAAFMRLRHEILFEQMNAEVFAHSSQFATEAIGAFRTVSALTMEGYILEKYSSLLKQQIRQAFRRAWHATLVFALSDSVELCAMALTLWYGGQLLASREYDPLSFFVIYIAIVQGGQAAGQTFSLAPVFAQATSAANRIFSLRHKVDQDRASLAAEPLPLQNGAKVELKQVSFKYPTRDAPIFLDLDVTIKSGQFVAFVGPSGCGKTTVISLLERFYDPTSGAIYFNGRDVRSIELSSYRRSLALVAQEPRLFDGTIRENLLLGLGEACSEEQMVQACKDAEIHDFIMSLPEGYGTELGIQTQTALSGGQKQRLCIARALLRKPSLLLLDEATSSLDSQSEKLVQAALERLAAQRRMTIVAVAHRLATTQKADTIFVFSGSEVGRGSRIVERGSHQELLRRRGTYWQMCQAQALDQ
ncbi:hypothetical protein VTN77DRAFT_8425 [Rasamsonia byssochlamydoides]|uniref:uncharacterized protein n=1 Tax=Rasamsonia byssochlamydoides TaxID=89139 RepID=UPI0037437A49